MLSLIFTSDLVDVRRLRLRHARCLRDPCLRLFLRIWTSQISVELLQVRVYFDQSTPFRLQSPEISSVDIVRRENSVILVHDVFEQSDHYLRVLQKKLHDITSLLTQLDRLENSVVLMTDVFGQSDHHFRNLSPASSLSFFIASASDDSRSLIMSGGSLTSVSFTVSIECSSQQ